MELIKRLVGVAYLQVDRILLALIPSLLIYFGLVFYGLLSIFPLLVFGIMVEHKRRQKDIKKYEREKLLGKVERFVPSLNRLEKLVTPAYSTSISSVAHSLTVNKNFKTGFTGIKGWERYFLDLGKVVFDKFNQLKNMVEKLRKEDLSESELTDLNRDFYDLTSTFLHLYKHFLELVEEGGGLPEDFSDYDRFRTEYDDFIRGLRDLSDASKDIAQWFSGKDLLEYSKDLKKK